MNKLALELSFIRDQYISTVIGKEIFPRVTSIPPTDNPIAVVCDFFLRKSTKTLDAICVLCEAGFAEDALVLVRTIFELSLHLNSIASASSIEQRRHKALCFIYDGERQREVKLKEFSNLKEQGKCLSWIGEIEASSAVSEAMAMPNDFTPPKNLKDMAAELATTTDLGEEWECLYTILYWSLSKFSHPSGLGSHTYIQDCDHEAEASRAISLALTMHNSLIICVLNMLDLENLRPRLDECTKGFILFSQSTQ